MGYIGVVNIDGTPHKVGSTLFGTCATEAATAAKVVTCSDFTELPTGVTIHVKFTYSNTAANPTLNINSKGAKAIYRYGTTVPGTTAETSWNAGAVVSFTYDGTNFIMNDWLNASTWNSITGKPSTFPPSAHSHDNLDEITTYQPSGTAFVVHTDNSKFKTYLTRYNNAGIDSSNGAGIFVLASTWSSSVYTSELAMGMGDSYGIYYRGKNNGTYGSWQAVGRFTATPTSGQVIITDGTTGGMKSSGYTIAKSVPSNAIFTDVNVTQTATTTNANYEVLFSSTADNTTRTETARKNSNLTFNPSTGTLTLPIVTTGTANIDTANITEDNVGNLIVTGAARFLNTINGNISGNAEKLNGYASDTSATNNTIARRTANGYIFATYFNQSSSAETPTSSSYMIYANSDGYFRKSSLANIKTILGLGEAAYKAVDTTVTSGSSNLITSGAVAQAIDNLPEPMVFKGTLGTNGTITTLPTASASNEGYTYKVITAGTYASQAAKVGDVFVCAELTSGSYSWVLIPAGDTDSDSWRNIKINGTEKLTTVISSGAVDFVNGTNTTVSFNATGNKIQIDAVDTKYGISNSGSSVVLTAGGTGTTVTLDSLLSNLPTWTANPTDDTYFIRRDTSGSASFGQLKFSTMWNYFKGKADSVYAPISHSQSANTITAGYLNTQPENSPIIIPFIHNDLAFMITRGGSTSTTYDGTAQTIDLSGCFDGGPGYGYAISNSGDYTTIEMILNLHQSFGWTNTIYVDFGSVGWRAKDVQIDVMNSNFADDTWTTKYHNTNNGSGHCYVVMTHTPVGASNAGSGFNKIRFTFKTFNSSMFRITQFGVYNYGSGGVRTTYMSRGIDDTVWRNITPATNNTYNLGTSSLKWGTVYATTFNGNLTTGGTITSSVTTSTHINGAKGIGVIVNSTASNTGYNMWIKANTNNGAYNMGYYQGKIHLYYISQAKIDAGTNSFDKDTVLFDESGNMNVAGTFNSVGAITQNGTAVSLQGHTHNYAGSSSAGGSANSLANFAVSTTTGLALENTTNIHGYVSGLTKADWNYQQVDGAIYAQFYSASWKHQIYGDYRTGHISLRGKNNGTWQNWLQVLDSGNIGYNMTSTVVYNPHTRKFTTSKSTSAWDAQVYSQYGYADAVYVTFKPNQTNMAMMVGLDSNPSEDANYNKIDYALYCMNNGKVSIYESGSEKSVGLPTYAAGDEFKVEYVGGYVRYYQNGTLLREVARSISGKLYMDSSFHGATSCIYDVEFGCTATNAKYAASAEKATKDSDGNAINSTYLKKSGGTMTGQILTSFKYAVAMGSRVSDATTIPDLCDDLRYSSGCCGSVNIGTAYTLNNITIAKGWYNYLWVPHRSGGNSGAASGDNCNYGSLYLSGMTLSGCYMIRYASAAIAELRNLYADNNTTYGLGTSGNNITIVASGTTTSITAPYATSAGNATTVNNLTVQTAVPANALFTDQNVSQSVTTTGNWRKIVLSYQDSASAGTAVTANTNVVYVTPNAEIQPSTGTIRTAGNLQVSGTVCANVANSSTAGGLSLYGTDPTAYGVIFRGTGNQGKHGYVQSDWATYFTMSNTDNRGWVFRRNGVGNVASINTSGNMVLNGSLTIGGNTTNTSGARLVYNSNTSSIDFIFVA